jgi:molybdenum cofactor cytidylyltransferase
MGAASERGGIFKVRAPLRRRFEEERVLSRRPAFRPPALLILAAGASERHGGRPKALLEVDGRPAVRRVLEVGLDAGLSPAVVVVGPHRVPIAGVLKGEPAEVVENPLWELGRTGSVQLGLAALPEATSVVLWPVDHPFVRSSTIDALSARATQDAVAAWLIPSHQGRGGHPVLIKRSVFGLIHALDPDESLRSLLPRLGVQVARMPVGDPWVLVGTDTPEAYREAVSRRREEGEHDGP